MNQKQHKLAVLVSGSGTLLEHMATEHLPINLVIAEKPCRGLEVAKSAKYQTELLPRTNFGWDNSRRWNDQPEFARVAFSIALAKLLNSHNITITAMAGFMTILSPIFFETYKGTLLNIHPALLPKYKGERAVADALEAEETVTGTTIHIATKELDAGPIIEQAEVPVLPDDTVETLHERIKQTERPLYAQALAELLTGERQLPPQ
jgi:formyltetrahydrofolate-dependent phosphoribosylglycinamide formyltransferase